MLLTVATPVEADTHAFEFAGVPDPVSCVVDPAQTESVPVIVGSALTVSDEVVLLQPVEVWVKVKVTLPVATPVTRPALVTVAFVASLLVQVPPVVGDNVIVLPTQTDDPALTAGSALTVTDEVVLLQPVEV